MIYGLFVENASFISQNFDEQSIVNGAINGIGASNPANAFSGHANTQPDQGTATGVDVRLASHTDDGNNATTIGLKAQRFGG